MNGVDVVEAFPMLKSRVHISDVLSKGIDCARFGFQEEFMRINKINFLKSKFFIVFDFPFMISEMKEPFKCIVMYLKIQMSYSDI